ncbi:MAG: V-type ATP synthase subunit D [Eubacteriales bacterium]
MALLRVNPTRMELTRLKKRLKVAVRGHKLLKDKRDEMVRQFIELVKENKRLREETEEILIRALNAFLKARLAMAPEEMEEALMFPAREITVKAGKKNIMSIDVPRITFEEVSRSDAFLPYGFLSTSGELDTSIVALKDALPNMLKLAGIEKTCDMLADEIEKTRRRVNALEYVLIPQLEETIKYIVMKLDENERGNLTRLMKMKEMLHGE